MSNKWHGGKGSTTRPTDVDKYNENWDRIFGDKKKDSVKPKKQKLNEVEFDDDALHMLNDSEY
jgi:hypothetical protein